ncbi:sulfur carrier protein ThiS [Frisingicoccus sp.]|uniref:sulfur carrier protein ThiS n=1 Tax=Frisingicoccus sp. TaxID=1918627 RepID=UPI0015B8E2AD
MKVNGETVTLTQPVSLKEFLESSGYTTKRIAVERNGEIVPKQTYDSVMLTEADTLEIVHFVGGG